MSAAVAPLAILCGLSLGAVAVSLWTMVRVKAWIGTAGQRATAGREEWDGALAEVRRAVEGLSERMEELRQQPQPAAQAVPRAGLNLGKRSQALRMHRRGESAEQIAGALEIPRQEVDLLLKVHRIAMNSMM